MTLLAGTTRVPRASSPAERLEQHGVGTLSDAELLAILAGPNGGRTADTVLDVHPPDSDHAGRSVAWCGTAAVRRHVADEPAVATILTSAQDLHPHHRPPQRRPHLRSPRRRSRRARKRRRFRHQTS